MPACGQAVGCGVCDTPELWRGAAGLCARVCACASAESLHTYIRVAATRNTKGDQNTHTHPTGTTMMVYRKSAVLYQLCYF